MHAPATLFMHEWQARGPAPGVRPPTAVLVHGVTGWHRTWWRVASALADRGWRVVAVDQRGHGHSPRIEAFTTVGQWAAELAAAIERVGAPADALVGHSLGAAVSAELAFTRPDFVRRLVLEDPPAVTRADDVVWHAALEREHLAAVADPEGEVARTLAANPTWLGEDARQDVEGKQLADLPGLLATFRRDTGARVLELAPRLTVPALYLMAAEDRSVFGGDARRQLAASLPADARMLVVDAGHTVHRDRFDEYVRAVVAWIEEA